MKLRRLNRVTFTVRFVSTVQLFVSFYRVSISTGQSEGILRQDLRTSVFNQRPLQHFKCHLGCGYVAYVCMYVCMYVCNWLVSILATPLDLEIYNFGISFV